MISKISIFDFFFKNICFLSGNRFLEVKRLLIKNQFSERKLHPYNRVSRINPDLAAKPRKNTTGESELMNNHCKRVLTSLVIIPEWSEVV